MDSWHATFLGLRHLPREVTTFEIEVFFQFSSEEARIIEERRRPELKLGLALQIGFLRMSGRLLDADGATATVAPLGRTIALFADVVKRLRCSRRGRRRCSVAMRPEGSREYRA